MSTQTVHERMAEIAKTHAPPSYDTRVLGEVVEERLKVVENRLDALASHVNKLSAHTDPTLGAVPTRMEVEQ